MAQDTVLSHIQREFSLWGVKPEIRYTGGGHIELKWRASPDKEPRLSYIPKTGSDWRGWMNQRSHIRRLFKQDGLSCTEPPKPEPVLHKALALPTPPPPKEDVLRDVRVELATLSEMVFELAAIVTKLSTLPMMVTGMTVPNVEPAAPVAPVQAAAAAPGKMDKAMRRIKAIEHVSTNWNSTDALATSMGLDEKFAYRKLYALVQKGEVEKQGNRWRKKSPEVVAKPNGKTNGKTNGKNGFHAAVAAMAKKKSKNEKRARAH